MRLATTRDDQAGATTVTVEGEVDTTVVGNLFEACAAALAGSDDLLQLDLSGVTFMDSMGIDALVRARNAARGAEKRLVLLTPSVPLRRWLAITGLDHAFEIIGSPAA